MTILQFVLHNDILCFFDPGGDRSTGTGCLERLSVTVHVWCFTSTMTASYNGPWPRGGGGGGIRRLRVRITSGSVFYVNHDGYNGQPDHNEVGAKEKVYKFISFT